METEKNRDKNPDRIIYVAMTLFNNFLFKRKHGHAASTRCVYDARLLFQHFINKNKLYTCIYFYPVLFKYCHDEDPPLHCSSHIW